jgi:tetratricopeptide (TPR) repeat protein
MQVLILMRRIGKVSHTIFKEKGTGPYEALQRSLLNRSQEALKECKDLLDNHKNSGKKEEGSVVDKTQETLEENWKRMGNLAFGKGLYKKAIQFYTNGLQENPKSVILIANRAACHLQLENWQQCKDDAKAAIDLDPKYVKGNTISTKS